MMTIDEVKRDLPQVLVRLGKNIKSARVTGRLCQFAQVTISGEWSHALGACWEDRKYSWEAVTRAVNTGKPLNWD